MVMGREREREGQMETACSRAELCDIFQMLPPAQEQRLRGEEQV